MSNWIKKRLSVIAAIVCEVALPVALFACLRVRAGEELLTDGRMCPSMVWTWTGRPIEVVTDLGGPREVGGVRILSGRSVVNCCVRKASFYAAASGGWKPLAEHIEFRPANTYKEIYATWSPITCGKMKMVIEDTWDGAKHYYGNYTTAAAKELPRIFDAPFYPHRTGPTKTVQIAEMGYFGKTPPDDLPLPNRDGSVAYPESRLVRDWMFQSCAVSNVSHCANVEPDTTRPDPLGEDIGLLRLDAGWRARRMEARRQFLAGFRAVATSFVYVKHLVMGNSIVHATDDLTDASWQEWRGVPDYRGGSQLVLATINADGTVSQEVLLEEPQGVIRDPAVSPDGGRLLFSRRRTLTDDNYHLWTMDLQTRETRQITFDPVVRDGERDFRVFCSDIEPCWLPDGSVMFQSTRCGHSVDCWPLPVSNIYRCDADGRHLRRIGFDQVQTFYPQPMGDGRIVYTRWEYNDRETSFLEKLFVMNADGTRQTGFFGNNSEFPAGVFHARNIPSTESIMAINTGHHVAQKGRLIEVAPAEGDDYTNSTYDPSKSLYGICTNAVTYNMPGKRTITLNYSEWDSPFGATVTNMPGMYNLAGSSMDVRPGRVPSRMPKGYHYNAFDMQSQFGPQWAYPFPLSRDRLLVSFMPEGCSFYRGPYSSRFGIYAQDAEGRRELLAFDWGNHCMQPVALVRRPAPPNRMKKIDYSEGFGTYYVQDVLAGAAAVGLKRGEVKRVRVVAMELRPVHIGWNWQYGWHTSEGKIGTPVSVGNGAYDVKHVLGEADVEPDGSASFRVPARTPVYFQLIDADGLALQTMRSWSTLMPGEVNGCIGCHEHPHQAALDRKTGMAFRHPPQDLKPWLPGCERHPLLVRLEKEGPLASLDNWMGVNRPRRCDAADTGDGFSFAREIQPILDRKCVACHGAGHRVDLRGVPAELPPSDAKAMRRYTLSYLNLSRRGACDDKINFAHALSFAAFKPPRSFGAVRSAWYDMLVQGHRDATGKERVRLSDGERRRLACWIDLCVPFCGCYVEKHDWNDWYRQRFDYAVSKRCACAWEELNDVRAEKGLPALPLTGFVHGITEPRLQRWWDE